MLRTIATDYLPMLTPIPLNRTTRLSGTAIPSTVTLVAVTGHSCRGWLFPYVLPEYDRHVACMVPELVLSVRESPRGHSAN